MMAGRHETRMRPFWLVVVLTMLLAACAPGAPQDEGVADNSPDGTDAGGGETSDGTAGDGTSGGELVVATAEDPPTLESAYGYSATTGIVLRNVQEPLVGRRADTGEFYGLLANSWENVDPNTWRFELREGVTFHDGSPFNAEAAAFAVNTSWSEEFVDGPLLGFKGPNFEATAVDEYTLEIVTEEPDPILPNRLWLSPIFSMEHFQEEGEDAWREEPIGTGPYRFVEWERGQSITIERNADWWGYDHPDAADGNPTIDRAIFRIRGDQQSRIAAVEAGEAHLAERLPADQCMNDLGDMCLEANNIDIAHIRFDTMSEVMGDLRIRQAMAMAIDREAISEEILPGPLARMLVPEGATGYNPDVPMVEYDPDQARTLVEEAAADGVPVDTTINFRVEREKFPGVEEVGQAIQAMWQDIGLTVDFAVMESALYLEQVVDPERPISETRNWVILHQHSNRLADFHGTATSWMQCEAPISTWCNEEFTQLTDEAGSLTGEERHATLQEAAMLVYEDMSFVPVIEMGLFHGVASELELELRADTNVYLKNMTLEE